MIPLPPEHCLGLDSRSPFWAPLQGTKRYESQKSPSASELGQTPSGSTLSGGNFVKKGSYAQGEILCTGNGSTLTANLNQISLHGLLRVRSTGLTSWIRTPRPRQEIVQASDLKDLFSQPLSRTKQHHLPRPLKISSLWAKYRIRKGELVSQFLRGVSKL